MPRLDVIPANPTFGSQLGQALGGGLGTGISQGISSAFQEMLKRKDQAGKIDKAVQQSYGKLWNDLSEDQRLNAIKSGRKHFDEGNDFNDSILRARFPDQFDISPEEKPTITQKALGKEPIAKEKPTTQEPSFLNPFRGFGERAGISWQDTKEGLAKSARMLTKLADVNLANPNVFAQQFLPQAAGPSATERLDELTRGASIPSTPSQRIASEFFPYGVGGVAYQGAIEAAQALGAPEWAQEAIGLLGALATEGAKIPAGKIANKLLSKARKISAETGRAPGEILADALKTSEADMQKIAAGDVNEANKLNRSISKEVPEVGKKVAATEKTVFHKEAAMKEREAFGAKLPDSPFTAHFEIEAKKVRKEAAKKPETRAKEEARRAEIRPKAEEKYNEYHDQRRELKELQNSTKGLEGNALERAEASIALKERQIQKTLEEWKDLQYEMKYGHARPTEAQLDAQIKESTEKLIKEAKNPTAEGQKEIAKDLRDDIKYLKQAEEILARGELPGEFRPDTNVKIMEKYLKGYEAAIQELKDVNRSLKGARDAESLKRIAENKKAIEYLEGRTRRHRANLVNQKDKIKALSATEGPTGAFYRQQVKNARKGVEEFEKDFFQHVKEFKSSKQIATEKAAQAKIAEAPKIKLTLDEATKAGEKVGKNPTKENIKEGAEEVGADPKSTQEAADQFKSKMKENSAKIESGKATEQDVQKTNRWFNNFFNKYKAKQNIKSAATHFLIGIAAGIFEEESGYKINRGLLYAGAGLVGRPTRTGGRFIGFTGGHLLTEMIYNTKEANKLRSLKNNQTAYLDYIQNLKKRYSPERVEKIKEKAKS